MRDYLKVVYDEVTRPYTEYPRKLVHHLCNAFDLKEGMTLLEPGCGRGEHLRIFSELGMDVHGIDVSHDAPGLAKDLSISVCDLEMEALPYPDNNFDVIYSKSFLEHLKDPSNFLREAARVLKPGGLILSMVPDWESQHQKFYDDYTHVSPFTVVSLRNIQLATGFDNVKVSKFRQLPVVWQYPALNYLCAAIAPFVPVRTSIGFLRWSRELMLVGSGYKPEVNDAQVPS
ncbi:MAG: ubiquinone/menaquinone biosynthesis C-methylase UbiE [Candidatus Azotimanducaceae bacterium]|jgi:ubiquinone/menaquinone biosynthesis C-methylase UbiE